jgi:hypothetical protein
MDNKLISVRVKNGKFLGKDLDTLNKTASDEYELESISGKLVKLKLEDDPGNQKGRVKPHTKLFLTLIDEDNKCAYRLSTHCEITFAWVLATYLFNMVKNTWYKLTVKPGKDNSVSFPSVFLLDGKQVEREEFPKEQEDRLKKTLSTVESHECFKK